MMPKEAGCVALPSAPPGLFGAFYCDQTGGLVDRLRSPREGGGVDRAIRPNMVIAAALRRATGPIAPAADC